MQEPPLPKLMKRRIELRIFQIEGLPQPLPPGTVGKIIREALLALREPNDAMIEAGAGVLPARLMVRKYRAMIDAVLSEPDALEEVERIIASRRPTG